MPCIDSTVAPPRHETAFANLSEFASLPRLHRVGAQSASALQSQSPIQTIWILYASTCNQTLTWHIVYKLSTNTHHAKTRNIHIRSGVESIPFPYPTTTICAAPPQLARRNVYRLSAVGVPLRQPSPEASRIYWSARSWVCSVLYALITFNLFIRI